MGRKSTGWVEALEKEYGLDAHTLIPMLLTKNGAEWLALKAGVTMATVSRWCKAHQIERLIVYEARNGGAS